MTEPLRKEFWSCLRWIGLLWLLLIAAAGSLVVSFWISAIITGLCFLVYPIMVKKTVRFVRRLGQVDQHLAHLEEQKDVSST